MAGDAGNMEVGELLGDPTDLAEDGQWPEESAVDAFSKAGQVPPSQVARVATVPCAPLEMGKQCRFPGFPLIDRGGQQASRTFFWKGAGPFLSRVQDSGTKEPKSLILFRT